VAKKEEKDEASCINMKLPHTLVTRSTGRGNNKLTENSGDVRHRIAKPIRPSPSEEFEAEQDDPYRGIDLNEGWNRASFRGMKEHLAEKPSISNLKIRSDFAAVS
jgi:hypothetical protein